MNIELSELAPIWCKGCGNHSVLRSLRNALVELGLAPESTVIASGIGCSSRLPGYLNCFGFNSIHGRSLPLAVGIKLHNPALTVLCVAGDGDAISIGLNHLAHTARKNIDLTFLIFDNRVYGLTKGQTSPTTPLDTVTTTHPFGNIVSPLNIVHCVLAFGATFVARASALDVKRTQGIITEAVRHSGFSVVQIITPCVTFRFREEIDFLKSRCTYLENNGTSSPEEAARLSESQKPYYLGLFYHAEHRHFETKFHDSQELAEQLAYPDMANMLDDFTPR